MLSDYHCWNLLAAGPRGRREDVEWVWYCEGCVAAPIHEMRLGVPLAVLCSGFVECVFSVAMCVLCVNCGMGCRLLVAYMTENWCLGGTGWFILWDIKVFDQ